MTISAVFFIYWFLDTTGKAPSLKSLRLISCYNFDVEGLEEAIVKFPLLEELELSLSANVGESGVFGVVGRACPQLKRFRLSKDVFYDFEASGYDKDDVAWGLQLCTSCGLCSCLAIASPIKDWQLSWTITATWSPLTFVIASTLTWMARCAQSVQEPIWADSGSFSADYTGSGSDYELDSEDYDDYCDPSRYLDGVYEDELNEEDRMLLRGMRMLMK
ncbi:hypothetical protein CFC21_065667 [Triticum aestivum]|uniref:F-box domain-containing protein n=2 Tax=Triticum aestivum TaxID=4565 RepID=A0A9R1H5B0_WHEAT|nr:hypothetical protein CFC21_065667 [Triticum aestivum]